MFIEKKIIQYDPVGGEHIFNKKFPVEGLKELYEFYISNSWEAECGQEHTVQSLAGTAQSNCG